MRLFGKRKMRIIPAGRTGLMVKITDRMDCLQTRLAAFLNSKTADLSDKGKIFLLVAVCLLFGSICLYLLIQACH